MNPPSLLLATLALTTTLSLGIMTNAFASAGHANEQSTVGHPAKASQASKVINVTTLDTMKYTFSSNVDLKDGEAVTFVITNKGNITHEFSIGDAAEQKSHREMMRTMPNMVHSDGNAVTLKPGETKEITWQFKAGKEVVFACNIPGHFEAGMFKNALVENMHSNHAH